VAGHRDLPSDGYEVGVMATGGVRGWPLVCAGGPSTPLARCGAAARLPGMSEGEPLTGGSETAGIVGVDEQGREVLSFVPGEVHRHPLPPEAAGDDVLVALARLIRALHEASAGVGAAARRGVGRDAG